MDSKKTIKPGDVKRTWFLVDAKGKVLGRLATQVAKILQGKHRPYYTPHWDMGDFVVVINAKDVAATGKKEKQKVYYRHSGYPGALRKETLEELRKRRPTEIVRRAVTGMMPKNKLARQMMKKLYVYAGEEHPHQDKELKELMITVENAKVKSQKSNLQRKSQN